MAPNIVVTSVLELRRSAESRPSRTPTTEAKRSE